MHELADWWNRISLRTKVTGVTVLLLTAGLVVAGVGTMAVLRGYLQDEVDLKITAAAEKLQGEIRPTGTGSTAQCRVSQLPNELYLAVLDADAHILCSNRGSEEPRPLVDELTLATVIGLADEITLPSTEPGGQWRVGAYTATNRSGTEYFTVVVGLDLKDANAIVARYVAIFLFFGLTVVILGGALTRLLVTTTFAPLRDVEDTAARFAAGDFTQRLSGATPNTEVGRLNRSLNAMLARIDSAFADRARTIEQMRRFVGDASHELRTPLVSVRGYAELYRMGALAKPDDVAQAMERIEKEAIRMGGLVEDLLELARLDETKPLELAPIDLVPLANDAALDAMASSPGRVVTVISIDEQEPASPGAVAPGAGDTDPDAHVEEAHPPTKVLTLPAAANTTTPSRGVAALATGPIAFASALRRIARRTRPPKPAEVAAELPRPPAPKRAIVLAEENKVRQVLANLLGNAMRFTPDGSPIEIGVGVDGDRGVLAVIDHGEGIPPQIREKIFQRFWRADTSRTRETGGSGLGLAIVAAIVATHRGEVQVVETPGGGATFRVLLPLLPSESPADSSPSAP